MARRLPIASLASIAVLLLAAVPALAVIPSNDNFADAAILSGSSGIAGGSNVDATGQAGDPTAGFGGHSVWWTWTAAASGPTTFNTFGTGFDTVLAAATGPALGSLTTVAFNDDAGGGLQSQISFSATAGTLYYIVVDSFGGLTGPIVLNWYFGAPPSPPGPVPVGPGAVDQSASCRASFLDRNDDGSSGLVPIGFTPNFFGTAYGSLYVNNNGNVTFDSPLSTFTPFDLTRTSRVIIAPFFGDVDTRNLNSDLVTWGATTFAGRPAFCVSWAGVGVGYYSQKVDKLNSFQLLLVDRADTGTGNFDIVFNYAQIRWETGDASGGTGGLGGSSARVGFSNGRDTALELPGSAVNGALLDSNPTTGLISNSRNTLQLGRYIFPVRNGAPPVGGSIDGTVSGSAPQPNAPVTVCPSAGPCSTRFTNGAGFFSFSGLAAGTYGLQAFPPAGVSGLSPSPIVPVPLPSGGVVHQNVTLGHPAAPPADTTITSIGTAPGGIPVVYWNTPLTLMTHGCTGGTAAYQVIKAGAVVRSGPMAEGPAGTYTAVIAPLIPTSGTAQVHITIACPNPAESETTDFDIYIDPSGVVRTTGGAAVAGATVTLLRSDDAAGPFAAVPDGSALMSPANRRNPDLTNGAGAFGWDVIAGYYRVRAEKNGCHAPGNPGQAFVETATLTIPPPALDLVLVLDCGVSDAIPPVTSATLSTPANGAGWHRADVTVTLAATDEPGGSGVASIRYRATGAQVIPDTTAAGASVLVTITQEGTTTVFYYARDIAGNSEAEHSLVVRLDKTAPQVTVTKTPAANAAGWNNTPTTVRFAATDAAPGSGLAGPSFFDVFFGSEGAGQSASRTFADVAGNERSANVVVSIDLTAPELRWTYGEGGVVVTVRDGLSGAPAGPLAPVSVVDSDWKDDDPDGAGKALTRTFEAMDAAGNRVRAVDQVKGDKHKQKARVIRFGYGAGAPADAPDNRIQFEWKLNDGDVRHLEQKATVGKGDAEQQIDARYRQKTDETDIQVKKPKPKEKVTVPGVVTLWLGTDRGSLKAGY